MTEEKGRRNSSSPIFASCFLHHTPAGVQQWKNAATRFFLKCACHRVPLTDASGGISGGTAFSFAPTPITIVPQSSTFRAADR